MTRLFFIVLAFFCCQLAVCQDARLTSLVEESVRLRAESKYDSALLIMEELTLEAKKTNNYEFLSRAAIE